MKQKNFDKLPIAEQRVLIARDVIARLDAKKFIAQGGYLVTSRPIAARRIADGKTQVQEVLAERVCRGCQIGGMFAAAVDRFNALLLDDLNNTSEYSLKRAAIDPNDMRDYLGRWFSAQTLTEVEHAFEGWEADEDVSFDFGFFIDAYPKADARMRLIAQNIIDNKGQFKPKQILKLASE